MISEDGIRDQKKNKAYTKGEDNRSFCMWEKEDTHAAQNEICGEKENEQADEYLFFHTLCLGAFLKMVTRARAIFAQKGVSGFLLER
jgi:hypothetical protein